MPIQEVIKATPMQDANGHDYALVTFRLKDRTLKERKVYDHKMAATFLDNGPGKYSVTYDDDKTHYMVSVKRTDGGIPTNQAAIEKTMAAVKKTVSPEEGDAQEPVEQEPPTDLIDQEGPQDATGRSEIDYKPQDATRDSIQRQTGLKCATEIFCALVAAGKTAPALKELYKEVMETAGF